MGPGFDPVRADAPPRRAPSRARRRGHTGETTPLRGGNKTESIHCRNCQLRIRRRSSTTGVAPPSGRGPLPTGRPRLLRTVRIGPFLQGGPTWRPVLLEGDPPLGPRPSPRGSAAPPAPRVTATGGGSPGRHPPSAVGRGASPVPEPPTPGRRELLAGAPAACCGWPGWAACDAADPLRASALGAVVDVTGNLAPSTPHPHLDVTPQGPGGPGPSYGHRHPTPLPRPPHGRGRPH